MSTPVIPGPVFHDDPEEQDHPVNFFQPPRVVSNRHATAKKAAKAGLALTEKAIGVAQTANHVGTFGTVSALATGAAVSATGIGLLAAAGAGMAVSSVVAARSAYKTHHHLKGLQTIYDNRKSLAGEDGCKEVLSTGTAMVTKYSAASHEVIENTVLPYAIRQKAKKRRFKIASANPITSPLATVYAVSNKWGKLQRGELGKARTVAAKWLAAHFLECDCKLASQIIEELHGKEQTEAFASAKYDELWPVLANKLKST